MEEPFKDIDDLPASFGPETLAKFLRISRTQAYKIVNEKDFPKIRVGRKIIISKSHFRVWLDKQIDVEYTNPHKSPN